MFCCQLCGRDTIKRPRSCNLDGEEQGVRCAIIVTTAVIYLFKQQVDQQGQRAGTNLLSRLYTIRWYSEHKTLTLIFASNPASSKVNRRWGQR